MTPKSMNMASTAMPLTPPSSPTAAPTGAENPDAPWAEISQNRPLLDLKRRVQWTSDPLETYIMPSWTEDTEALATRIHGVLTPLLSQHWGIKKPVKVNFLAEGTWNRTFLVQFPHSTCPITPPDTPPGSPLLLPTLPDKLIFRAALPILPNVKILSEVATMQFVKHRTSIPVPRVYMFNASPSNELGYEWIMMEHMPGQPFEEVQQDLNEDAKLGIARTIAEWVDCLSRISFGQIGSLFMSPETFNHTFKKSNDGTAIAIARQAGVGHLPAYDIKQISNYQFASDWRLEYELNRGPFHNLRDYLLSLAETCRLEVHDPRQVVRAELKWHRNFIENASYEEDLESIFAKKLLQEETEEQREARHIKIQQSEARAKVLMDESIPTYWSKMAGDEDELADNTTMTVRQYEVLPMPPVPFGLPRYDFPKLAEAQVASHKLIKIIDSHVPNDALDESAVLHHWDINSGNILVDKASGQVTALLDWEYLYTVPLSLANPYYPQILRRGLSVSGVKSQRPSAHWITKYNRGLYDDAWVMRSAFDKRLMQLGSPWLAVKESDSVTKDKDPEAYLLRQIHDAVQTTRFSSDALKHLEGDSDSDIDSRCRG